MRQTFVALLPLFLIGHGPAVNLYVTNRCSVTISPRYTSEEGVKSFTLGPHISTNLTIQRVQRSTIWAENGASVQCSKATSASPPADATRIEINLDDGTYSVAYAERYSYDVDICPERVKPSGACSCASKCAYTNALYQFMPVDLPLASMLRESRQCPSSCHCQHTCGSNATDFIVIFCPDGGLTPTAARVSLSWLQFALEYGIPLAVLTTVLVGGTYWLRRKKHLKRQKRCCQEVKVST